MTAEKIGLHNDPRVAHRTMLVNGRNYKYLDARPSDDKIRGGIILIHGFPDISMGWRYQIPALLSLHLHIICPDMMGYGGTDSPTVPPEDLSLYGLKRAADDIKELARKVGLSKFIIGGHDWGGAVAYRVAQYHPDVVTHVLAICTPYSAPTEDFVSLDKVVERAPQFGYQKHFAGPEVELFIHTKKRIRQFLHGAYGARTKDGQGMLSPQHGVNLTKLALLGKTRLLSEKEMNYYVEQFSRNGLHGPLNWYRTRKLNWEDEKQLKSSSINVPTLFIQANRDAVLLPSLSAKMERHIPLLSRRGVDTAHWALWERPQEVNDHISEWIGEVVFGTKSKI